MVESPLMTERDRSQRRASELIKIQQPEGDVEGFKPRVISGGGIIYDAVSEDTSIMNRGEILSRPEFTDAILESIPGIVYVHDEQGNLLKWNKKHEQTTGYSSEELSKINHLSFYDQESAIKMRETIKIASETGHAEVEIPIQTKSGEKMLMSFSNNKFLINGEELYVGIGIDITESRRMQEEALYLSYHDKLTGAYNRGFFEKCINEINSETRLPTSIIFGDLNNLKSINDVLGHRFGDQLLQATANALKSACRAEDVVARWGGDEFAIIFPMTTAEDLEHIVQRIGEQCNKSKINGMPISISIGSATYSSHDQDINEIINEAEKDCMERKAHEKKMAMSLEGL
jgi:diguanylate cyclase (GGDEF)-like protein/PAS domain S-box-containing protein